MKSVKEMCKNAKLANFEYPGKVALVQDIWSPENNMLTAAMKMKRPVIAEACQLDISEAYMGKNQV